jgi:hypothetical protein
VSACPMARVTTRRRVSSKREMRHSSTEGQRAPKRRRRLGCRLRSHRWLLCWDYFAGVLHIHAECQRCGSQGDQAVDLLSVGPRPTEGEGLVYHSAYGEIGPILWNDESTWSNLSTPIVLHTERIW